MNNYITWAHRLKLVNGYCDSEGANCKAHFGPEDNITRSQAAKMVSLARKQIRSFGSVLNSQDCTPSSSGGTITPLGTDIKIEEACIEALKSGDQLTISMPLDNIQYKTQSNALHTYWSVNIGTLTPGATSDAAIYTAPTVPQDTMVELTGYVSNDNGETVTRTVFIPLKGMGVSVYDSVSTINAGSFGSLQEAIDFAAGLDKDVVLAVPPGTYNESIVLYDGIFLEALACDPSQTIIDGQEKQNVIKIAGNKKCGISGFTIRNSQKNGQFAGIDISGNCNVLINRCIITENKHGIRLNGNVQAFVINNNIVENESDGVLAHGNSPSILVNNIIAYNDGYGIEATGKALDTVYYNDVWQNAKGEYKNVYPIAGTDISHDPLFMNYPSNQQLQLASPCIDAGHPNYSDADQTRSDIGVYGGKCKSLDGKWLGVENFFSENPEGENNMKVIPNPNNGNFKVQLKGGPFNALTITVSNIMGKVVLQKKIEKYNSEYYNEEVNLEGMNEGVYFINVNAGKQIFTRKVILVH